MIKLYATYTIRVNVFTTDADFDQIAIVDLHLEEVATAWRHWLVPDHRLKGVSVAHDHSYWSKVLVDKFFVVLESVFSTEAL